MSIKSSLKTVLTLGQGVVAGIPEAAADADPIELFRSWLGIAEEAGIHEPNAIALATATPDGVPSVRMVLLKGIDERGFVFFTNYESRKAAELEANPNAGFCIHWPVLERQIRVTGSVSRVTEEESYAYFRTRGRGSRLGAWASLQSRPLPDRSELEERLREVKDRFSGDDVPPPSLLGADTASTPDRIEFWQGKADRLHERLVFSRRPGEAWRHGAALPLRASAPPPPPSRRRPTGDRLARATSLVGTRISTRRSRGRPHLLPHGRRSPF